jgi:hypothetical protein
MKESKTDRQSGSMTSLSLSPNYISFLSLMAHRKVEYLLVGGYAVQYYGYSRPTRDLDLWIGTYPQNATKVLEVCQVFGSGIPELTFEPFQHNNRIIRIQIPPIAITVLDPIIGQQPDILHQYRGNQTDQIELLTVQSGATFEICFAQRIIDKIDEVNVNIISMRHLRAIKQVGTRAKDLDDLIHLESA